MSVPHATGIHPRDKILLGAIRQPGKLAFEKRHFNCSSPAGYGSPVKRSQNCVASEQAANDICNCHSRFCRLALRVTRDTHEATARLNQEVIPWLVLIFTRPKTGDRAIDKARIELLQAFVIHFETA